MSHLFSQKRMRRFPLLVLFTIVMLISIFLPFTGPAAPEWKPRGWNVVKEQFNVITAIDPGAGTVNIHHVGGTIKADRSLKSSAFTEVMVDGKKSTFAAMKVGMHVLYTLGGDGDTVARIENVVPQAPPPTPVATATPSFPKGNKN